MSTKQLKHGLFQTVIDTQDLRGNRVRRVKIKLLQNLQGYNDLNGNRYSDIVTVNPLYYAGCIEINARPFQVYTANVQGCVLIGL